MFKEAGSASEMAALQLATNAARAAELGAELRARKPRAVITIARGSSDHAATFARYMIETELGILTSSLAPSIGSVYGASVDLKDTLCLAISQSGKSPDLIKAVETAKAGGAMVVALINAPNSPLEAIADASLPLMAGPELSVAATKSFILTMTAITQLVAAWSDDAELAKAVSNLPAGLAQAWNKSWPAAVETLKGARNLFVVGRGMGFGVAQEAALKFKETCGLHAEAFSSAEVQHGPMALVQKDFPILAFAQDDGTKASVNEVAATFAGRGAKVLLAGGQAKGAEILASVPAHPLVEPILLIQSFYKMAAQLSVARGFDPDRPPHLNKVTSTL